MASMLGGRQAKHTKSGAEASFATDGDTLHASLKALNVLLCEEDGAWSAQGVEIDYAACGKDMNEAIHNFGNGLVQTVMQHLAIRGNLDKVLVFAPKEILDEWSKTPPAAISKVGFVATAKVFEEAKVPQAEELARHFPYEGLRFVKPEREAVPA